MADILGTSHNFVAKVWRECGFKPHLISQFKISNDPQFAEKLEDKVKNWLKRNKRVTLHFMPTSSSWPNLVERSFGLIAEKQIRRGVCSSVSELEEKIMQYIEVHNENPKPFVWTKPADEIMAKINRARLALSNV